MRISIVVLAFLLLPLVACADATGDAAAVTGARFLALGDSYTIGESVAEAERWPVQLAAMLRESGIEVSHPQLIARTGWTTAELATAIESENPKGPYDLVSLLIGVNNEYRGGSLDAYRTEFRALLQTAIGLAGGDPGRVIVVSIPDWSVTPFAEGRDRAALSKSLDSFNAVNREEALTAGARYVDITPGSREAANEPRLTANDGLHPSGAMYREWALAILPEATAALGR